nr:MAG TPA: hypothetical protein [Caudoviricetes sp.]
MLLSVIQSISPFLLVRIRNGRNPRKRVFCYNGRCLLYPSSGKKKPPLREAFSMRCQPGRKMRI